MIILKNPHYENDDYLFRISTADIPPQDVLNKRLGALLPYFEKKRAAFLNKDTNPHLFVEFSSDRPSLGGLSKLNQLDSTVYTVACEKQNGISHSNMMQMVRDHLGAKPGSRRCMIRMSNSYIDYFNSEMSSPQDVTCLSLIHYFEDKPRLVFRASDIENELIVDILTIIEFFIRPVYAERPVTLSIYASTCQNYVKFWDFVESFMALISKEEAS